MSPASRPSLPPLGRPSLGPSIPHSLHTPVKGHRSGGRAPALTVGLFDRPVVHPRPPLRADRVTVGAQGGGRRRAWERPGEHRAWGVVCGPQTLRHAVACRAAVGVLWGTEWACREGKGKGTVPGRSPRSSVKSPSIPRSVPSGSRGHRHPSAPDRCAFVLTSPPGV